MVATPSSGPNPQCVSERHLRRTVDTSVVSRCVCRGIVGLVGRSDDGRGSCITAVTNGDYGAYAFDSVHGQFDHSYASGSPDSGLYIGQCEHCDAVVTDVVAEYNQT